MCGEHVYRGDLSDVVAHVLLAHPEREAEMRALLDEFARLGRTPEGRLQLRRKYPAFAQAWRVQKEREQAARR